MREQSRIENYIRVHEHVQTFSKHLINETHTRILLQSESTFDLIMSELYFIDTFFALGGHFNAPIIGLSFQSLQPIYSWIMKNPWSFSYIPHLYLPFSDQMHFMQRLVNTLFGIFTVLFYNFVSLPTYKNQIESLMSSVNVEKIPNIEEVTKNISLILVESHFSVGYVRPYVPNVIEVAGVHMPPPNKLSKVINIFASLSKISSFDLVDNFHSSYSAGYRRFYKQIRERNHIRKYGNVNSSRFHKWSRSQIDKYI